MNEMNKLFSDAFAAAIDPHKASCLLADALNTPAMQEFQKDQEVLEIVIDSHTPTVAELHSQRKTHTRQKRRDDVKHAQKRMRLFKNTVHPDYLAAHPEELALGRFKHHGPYTHSDSLYVSGFDEKKGGYIRNRRKPDDSAEQLAEYYEDRDAELAAIAEAKRIEQADRERPAQVLDFIAQEEFEATIAIDNAEMELAWLERRLEDVKHSMAYNAHKLAMLKAKKDEIATRLNMSEEEASVVEYTIKNW